MKSANSTFPVLIVGQGLAGSILAHQLEQNKIPYHIWNSPQSHFTSSFAAGGIFNPITGRKLEQTWLANDLFDYLFPFYEYLERILEDSFFYPMPLFRPFANDEMKNWLLDRKLEIDNPYLDWSADGVWIKKTGWLDVAKFLRCSREYFKKNGHYEEREYDFSTSSPLDQFSSIVFCEGFHAQHKNPIFGHLNFLPAKGELLRFINNDLKTDVILNKNGFILPLEQNEFKVGATYRWDNLSSTPHEDALIDLEKKLRSFGVDDYEPLEVICGVRPATQDRRPFVGFHPTLPYAIFNGFGSKGVSLSPFFAKEFVDELLGKSLVNSEASIRRFNHLFSI
ncbi:NAD(P)/FAD-dependent oxidoreductase [Aquirufa sp. ROCK2-A2]